MAMMAADAAMAMTVSGTGERGGRCKHGRILPELHGHDHDCRTLQYTSVPQ
jgi:hypothetical protein